MNSWLSKWHIPLVGKTCIFCQEDIGVGERCVAAIGDTEYEGISETFGIEHGGEFANKQAEVRVFFYRGSRFNMFRPCHQADCVWCIKAPEAYIAHKTCLPNDLTKRQFWEVGKALHPWFAPSRSGILPKPAKPALQPYLGRRICALPEELFHLIVWEYAAHSGLRRMGIASQFNADLVKTLRSSQETTIAFDFTIPTLRAFDFCFLGTRYRPFLPEKAMVTHCSFLRIAIDHLGIRNVELFSEFPTDSTRQSRPGLWYILERFSDARQKYLLVSSGPFIRLKDIYGTGLQMWDADRPPKLGSYSSVGKLTEFPSRIRTIDMTNITGLTVFCGDQEIYGLYAHRGNESAITAYKNLSENVQLACLWRYFPLSKGETIENAWLHNKGEPQKCSILQVSTSHDRQCLFSETGFVKKLAHGNLCDSTMTHLHYEEPYPGMPISWFGATSISPMTVHVPAESLYGIAGTQGRFRLENVHKVEVYTEVDTTPSDDEFHSCSGVLLTYTDGTHESVGQRRFGLNGTIITQVDSPTWLCYRLPKGDMMGKRGSIRLHFSPQECSNVHAHSKWKKMAMVGSISWSARVACDEVEAS